MSTYREAGVLGCRILVVLAKFRRDLSLRVSGASNPLKGFLPANRSIRAGFLFEGDDCETSENAGARVLVSVGLITHGLPSKSHTRGGTSMPPRTLRIS